MCYHNYTQHNGCGHIGECHTTPWTLCAAAEQRLASIRGPLSPPIISHSLPSSLPSPKPTASTNKLSKRFTSFSLSRSSTSGRTSSYPKRSASGPSPKAPSKVSTSAFFLNEPTGATTLGDVPEHQLNAVKCADGDVVRKTNVSSQMEVCKECKRWIGEMRHLIRRYEKTGSVMGTVAFEEFLKYRGGLGLGGVGAGNGYAM